MCERVRGKKVRRGIRRGKKEADRACCTWSMYVRAPSKVYAPRAKIRIEIAAITDRPREMGVFIIRGHLNTAREETTEADRRRTKNRRGTNTTRTRKRRERVGQRRNGNGVGGKEKEGRFYARLYTGIRGRYRREKNDSGHEGGKREARTGCRRGKHAKVMYPPCLSSSLQSAETPRGSGVTFPKSQRIEEDSSRRKHEGKHETSSR